MQQCRGGPEQRAPYAEPRPRVYGGSGGRPARSAPGPHPLRAAGPCLRYGAQGTIGLLYALLGSAEAMVSGIRITLVLAAGCAGVLALSTHARADAGSGTERDPSLLCSDAVVLAERAEAIPRNLLGAIAQAESGRPVTEDRVAGPWPWTVTTGGTGLFFASKEEAMEAAAEALAAGRDNVDVGCLQINIGHHPDAFMSLEEAFDPLANAAYGAAYLRALFMETGSWPEAVGRYHSATPTRNSRYRAKVLDFWNSGKGKATPTAEAAAAEARRPAVPARERSASPATPLLDADVLGELKSRLQDLAPRQ